MPRRWEPHRVRSGNGAKNIFSCTCSRCSWTGTFESFQNLPDEVVSKKFQHYGWLLGRSNAHNICKRCLSGQAGVQPKNELANVFKVVENGSPVTPSRELRAQAAQAIISQDDAEQAKIDDIIDRHFSPKKLPESEVTMADASNGKTFIPMGLNLEQTLDLIQALKGIKDNLGLVVSELGNVRAALELQAEMTDEMVKNSTNQVKALTLLGPLIAKTTEAVSVGFANKIADPVESPKTAEADLARPTFKVSDDTTEAAPSSRIGSNIPLLAELRDLASRQVSIHSTPCKTGPQAGRKWYTTIRVSREMWNAAKLDGLDRVMVSRKNGTISVSKPMNDFEGIKIKRVNDSAAILHVSNLGDINTQDMLASVEDGLITLRA